MYNNFRKRSINHNIYKQSVLLNAILRGDYDLFLDLIRIITNDNLLLRGLLYSIEQEKLTFFKIFLKKFPHLINIKDEFGTTALMEACYHGRLEIIKLLIEKGADLDLVDNSGYSALILSIINGNYDITLTLLQYGANIHIIDKLGRDALEHCYLTFNDEIFKIINFQKIAEKFIFSNKLNEDEEKFIINESLDFIEYITKNLSKITYVEKYSLIDNYLQFLHEQNIHSDLSSMIIEIRDSIDYLSDILFSIFLKKIDYDICSLPFKVVESFYSSEKWSKMEIIDKDKLENTYRFYLKNPEFQKIGYLFDMFLENDIKLSEIIHPKLIEFFFNKISSSNKNSFYKSLLKWTFKENDDIYKFNIDDEESADILSPLSDISIIGFSFSDGEISDIE